MSNDYSVRGNVDGWCTKCKLLLAHTIIAMANNMPVKVKCNTCNSSHKFRPKQSGISKPRAAKPKSSARKVKTQEANYNDYMSRLTDYDLTRVKIYSMDGSYKKDEIIEHFKFGVGIVLSLIPTNKIEMLFKDGPRVLVHNTVLGPNQNYLAT